MKKKYSGIHKLRKWKEEKIQNEVGFLNHTLENDKKKLSVIKTCVSDHDGCIEKILKQGAVASIHEIGLHSSYMTHLSGQVQKQESLVECRSEEMRKKRVELGEAAKQRKIVETLRDKAWAEFLRQGDKKEQKELDEAATIRHSRRNFF